MSDDSDKRDYRTLDHKTLEFLRIRAVECVVEEGESPKDVARIFGLPVQDIYKWRKMHERGGWKELEAKPIPGRPRKLDDEETKCVGEIVRTDAPQAWTFPLSLWTRAEIAAVISFLFDVDVCLASVGNLMARLRFTCQRPLRRAYEQNRQRIEEWFTLTFPAILQRAKQEGGRIFFADESGVRSDYHSGTTWAPIGRTPVVEATGKRFRLNMFAAISPLGNICYEVSEGRLNSDIFIAFLQYLIDSVEGKIFLIVDNYSAHKSAKTRQFLATVTDRLELCFLPPYAQEYNPSELVWNLIKNHEIGRTAVHDKAEMKDAIVGAFSSLASIPKKVASLFHARGGKYVPACLYACVNPTY